MIRSTFSGLNTAFSALQASQKRLDITGQNLANMNTPGYTRQQLETSSLYYGGPVSNRMGGSSLITGYGVSMDRVSQIRDPYLDMQYRGQMTNSGYTDAFQSALDSLSRILDESNISGIRQAFDDIQSTLTSMQSKPDDTVYESELRSRMQALTNLLNSSANQINEAKKNQFQKLDGSGSSESGDIQKVNDILRQVGDLNHQIKRNQIKGQPSLELLDQRNLLLDELSSYLPVEISYYKDENHDGKDADGNYAIHELYDVKNTYDDDGNLINQTILGKKEWPDDLRVEMTYTDSDGMVKRFTLVDGTEGKAGENYAELKMKTGDADHPDLASIEFLSPKSKALQTSVTASSQGIQFSGGTIQVGLDMLGKDGSMTDDTNDVRGYQYYMNQLDKLAQTFADTMNNINKNGSKPGDPYHLLINKGDQTDADITAANIGISSSWQNGGTHIGTGSGTGVDESPSDTVMNMINAMKSPHAGLGNNSFSDFMNNVSSILANDSASNQTALQTNVTVLNGIQNARDSVSGVSLNEEGSNTMVYLSAYNAASRLMTALDEALNTLINSTGLVGR